MLITQFDEYGNIVTTETNESPMTFLLNDGIGQETQKLAEAKQAGKMFKIIKSQKNMTGQERLDLTESKEELAKIVDEYKEKLANKKPPEYTDPALLKLAKIYWGMVDKSLEKYSDLQRVLDKILA